ncbi:hypothetical protein [Pseudomonas sp. M20]|uniref:hypothetical protein n=1 Tax=Pseudomonas sp. M20 TaxID=3379129 RepID=UPI0038674B15
MDDSSDKLRRNVMLIGAVIISTILFDFSLKTSGSILGLIEIREISQLKTWLCLSILLIYFFLRYVFSDQVTEDRKKMKTGITNLRIKAAYNLLNKQISIYLKKDKKPSCITSRLPPLGLNDKYLRTTPLKFKVTIDALEENCGTGVITIKHQRTETTKTSSSTVEHKNLIFKLTKYQKIKILISTLIRTLTLSKSAVDYIAPLTISFASLLACTYKIVTLITPT